MALDNRSKETFFDHFYKNATHIKVPKKRKDLIAKGVGIHASWALLLHANIGLWNYRGTAYNEEENQILARMGQVFEQTYTRFLDLQKAEAQAREAKIEAALEKVRSQSLAMHTTSEMQLVANAVYEQLHALGLEMDVVGMSGAIEAKKDYDVWVGGAPLGSALRIPYNEDTKVQRDYNKMLEERPELFAKTYSGKVKKEYIDRLLTHGEFPKALRRKMETSDAFTTLIAPKKNSGIQVVRYSDQPFTEQDAEILKRFAGVFEQAYIRFMDLEKAEAQAREAQIQLALERVRAKSLAMKNSDELHQVLGVLFRQFDHLGIEPVNVFLSLFNREDRTLTYRASGKSGTRVPAKQVISVDSMEVLKALFDKWVNDNSDTVEVIYYPKEVLPQLFGIFAETFSSMPEGDRMGVDDFPDGGFSMAGHTPFGYLGYDHQRQATEEEKDILSRFCVEFTRVYQRFLDIQKAEAQAREAQIEMALEKIRSRTMAMQKSEELEETAALLFNQINNLGIQTFTSGFSIWQEAETAFMSYMAMPTGEMAVAMRTPLTEDVFFKNIYNAKKRGEDFFVFESKGESLAETYRYMGALPTVGKVVQSIKDSGFALPAFQITHCGFFPQGHLMFITLEPHPEAWDIFRRFTKVFEQTYTRFLDLQKAEARARESQIEMALEKVRSRTMAMHQSEELGEVASVMFEQISMLTSTPDRFNIGIANEADESFDIWVTDQNGHQVNRLFVARADKSPVISAFFKARKTKKSLAMDLHGKELKAWVRYMNKEVGIPFKEGNSKNTGISIPCSSPTDLSG
ncbi:MAG: hypothetical protein E4H26_05895 [Flavobacteriales bacterium]|nr:MAG: hypothetical protein E4H26_05895 [Flavobacteriales bacterium]